MFLCATDAIIKGLPRREIVQENVFKQKNTKDGA